MQRLPPPTLTDGRIVVRRLHPRDAIALQAAIVTSVDHLRPWMAWAADEPLPLETKRSVIADDDHTILGGTGLHPRIGPGGLEIGYWVRADRTRRGVATAAARLLTAAALRLDGIDRVEIHHDRANTASAAVPRRLGFRFIAACPDEIRAPGDDGVEWQWRMDAQTWAVAQAAS